MAIKMIPTRGLFRLMILSCSVFFVTHGCGASAEGRLTLPEKISAASEEFRRSQSHDSLAVIFEYLQVGMSRDQVEYILGQPHYCPDKGVCYYYSDRFVPSPKPGLESPVVLGVDYLGPKIAEDGDRDREVTSVLQEKYFGPIGE